VPTGLGRANRDAQDTCHLWQGHPEQIVEGDDRAMARIQARERLVQHLAVGKGSGDVGRRRVVDGSELDLDDPALAATNEVETGVDDEAMEPGVEPVGVAKSRQVTPGTDERFLDGIARELTVPEDQPGSRVQPRKTVIEQLREGGMLASTCSLDEVSLVHGRLGSIGGATMAVALDRVWRPRRRNGSPHRLG
jgi:hypothetical protein